MDGKIKITRAADLYYNGKYYNLATEQDMINKADLLNIVCNRSSCKKTCAEWWNPSTQAWYCEKCADGINEILPHPLCWHKDRLPRAKATPTAAESDVRDALVKAQEDIQWMLNNRQFLNGFVFDYIDKALSRSPVPPVSQDGDAVKLADALRNLLNFCSEYNDDPVIEARKTLAAHHAGERK